MVKAQLNSITNQLNQFELGKENITKLLIKSGADVNATKVNGETSLHLAAYHGKHLANISLIKSKKKIVANISISFSVHDNISNKFNIKYNGTVIA